MINRFQTRLLVTLLPLLLGLQCLTLGVVYHKTRQHIGEQSRAALAATRDNFQLWLQETTARLADSSGILAGDYGFRSAIATGDLPTIRSALANAATRLGAQRTMLIGPDGSVLADPVHQESEGSAFADPALLYDARDRGQAASVLVLDGQILEYVVVPVLAPDLIAWIGVGVAIDDAAAARLVRQSTIPIDLSFAFVDAGRWHAVATTLAPAQLQALLEASGGLAHNASSTVDTLRLAGESFATLLVALSDDRARVPGYAAIQYSLHAALAPHRPLFLFLAGAALAGFVLAAGAMLLVARGVTQPIRVLDAAARRIRTGEYPEPIALRGADEFGHLARTFNGMVADIAARERRIEYQANFDACTGLPNRDSFERTLAAAVDECAARPGGGERLLVMIVRLDNFFEINNTLGHAAGDQLIADAARRIQNCLKHGDLVSRFAQEKFAILLRQASDAMINAVTVRINLAFEGAFTVAGVNVDVTVQIGVASHPAHGSDARTLLRRAEIALREARASINGYALYAPERDPYTADRLSLMSDLRVCMESDQLSLHYQPKVDLPGERIRQVEALVRWRHPERGNVPPDLFIGIAETTGHIRRLTRWVVSRAIADCSRWHALGFPITVGVNVSAKDLVDPTLPSFIMQELTRHGLGPDALVMEITESAVMDSPELSVNLLRSLSAMGLRSAIDDFGTGHSSMAYVKRLPASELKIDRSFVTDLAHSRNDEIIVRAAIDLAHNLGMKVTAEGVEDAATAALLGQLRCDYAQGWHFGRPMPADALLAVLQAPAAPPAAASDGKVRPIR